MFAKYASPQLPAYALGSLGLSGLSAYGLSCWVSPWLGWPLGAVFFTVFLFTLWFFRDPERTMPGEAHDIISPADGTVTDVVNNDGDCSDFIEGKAHMVGIFLSVFDVHVNRSPLDGEVHYLRYKAGQFLDARHPDCGRLNEQQVIGMKTDHGVRFVVKQIAGLIARRIVCPLKPNDKLNRGERFGMIKFGSRTELWLDVEDCDVEWVVKPGDKVKGGLTILGHHKVKS